jgi:hypothetical protein
VPVVLQQSYVLCDQLTEHKMQFELIFLTCTCSSYLLREEGYSGKFSDRLCAQSQKKKCPEKRMKSRNIMRPKHIEMLMTWYMLLEHDRELPTASCQSRIRSQIRITTCKIPGIRSKIRNKCCYRLIWVSDHHQKPLNSRTIRRPGLTLTFETRLKMEHEKEPGGITFVSVLV